ncbi:MAG: hypothetical protein AAB425_09160 [Bdellovibrionota bacterium]
MKKLRLGEILESWRDALLGKSRGPDTTQRPNVRAAGIPGRKRFPARASRVQILPLHAVTFERKNPEHEGRFRIANLSTSGFALARGDASILPGQEPKAGARWVGILQSNGQGVVTVVAEAVHTASLIVGFRFIDPSRELSEWVLRQFKLELGALAMTEIARAILKDEEDGFVPVCYTGAGGAELFFAADPKTGVIDRFEMTFLGNVFSGTEGGPVKFGTLIENERDDHLRMKASAAVKWEPRMPADMLDFAIRFVNNIESLSSFRKLELVRHLSRIPREMD